MARERIDIRSLVESAKEISLNLTRNGIAHVVVGGVAVFLHGGKREDADDIDFFMGEADRSCVIDLISSMGFEQTGKYYKRGNIRIQIKFDGHPSYPDPNNPDECDVVDGVRVPTLSKTIDTKAEACRDILNEVLSNGVDGRRRRNILIKHASDLIDLVKAFGSQ